MDNKINYYKKERKVVSFPVRCLKANSPIVMDVEILPVEPFDYQNCLKEMDVFVGYIVDNADISLSVRLLQALFLKLPSMFPPDINKLIKELEEKEKKNGDGVDNRE